MNDLIGASLEAVAKLEKIMSLVKLLPNKFF